MSSDEPRPHEPDRDTDRPRFDDVASLFGNIVPPPGTPVQSRPTSRRAAILPDPTGPAILTPPPIRTAANPTALAQPAPPPPASPLPALPPELPPSPPHLAPHLASHRMLQAEPGLPPVDRTAPRPLPDLAASGQARKNASNLPPDLPWPDAFAPTRNYRRKPTSSIWTWLLLVPLLAIAAIGVFLLNPQTVRNFVDAHFPHVQQTQIGPVTSLLPAPFRPNTPLPVPSQPTSAPNPPPPSAAETQTPAASVTPTAPASDASAPASDVPAPASAPTESPLTAPLAEQPAAPLPTPQTQPTVSPPLASEPPPALPRADSLAVPPLPLPSPPALQPAAPLEAAAPSIAAQPVLQTGLSHIIVHYRRTQAAGEAEARRVVAQVERMATNVELRPGPSSYRAPTLVYYTPLDRDVVTALGRTLGEGWAVRAGPGRPTAGTVDIWLP